jgi:hypothetical protein
MREVLLMKLSEALLLRSEYQKKIENLQSRILANVKVQEGDKPLEDPSSLIKEAMDLNTELGTLIVKINARNNAAKLPDGQTISEAIVKRDTLIKQRNILSAVASKAHEKDFRLTHAEVKMKFAVSLEDVQKQIDDLSKKFREIDTQIQSVNWTTEL